MERRTYVRKTVLALEKEKSEAFGLLMELDVSEEQFVEDVRALLEKLQRPMFVFQMAASDPARTGSESRMLLSAVEIYHIITAWGGEGGT